MITKASNQHLKSRKCKNFGDSAIYLNYHSTAFFRKIFTKDRLIAWDLFKDYVRLVIACLAFAIGSFWRIKHGRQTAGFILTVCTLVLLLVLNSSEAHFIWKPFLLILWPLVPFFYEGELSHLVLVNIHSPALLTYTAAFAVLALIHTAFIYLGRGNHDARKRGDSWLYSLFLYRLGFVSESFVQIAIEPALTAAVGALFWFHFNDPVFASFLWAGASCMAMQEALDEAYDIHMNSMLPNSQ